MKTPSVTAVKAALFVLFVMALVILPFVLFGERLEASVLPLLATREHQAGLLTLIAIVLLASDSVAPIPATVVIMFLAWKAGWVAGIVGGTIGMCAGVLTAGWIGRAAVGRVAPRFLPDAEIVRLRDSLQRRLVLTLACLRSIPVLAETSVIVATAIGFPLKRVFWATVLPNLIVSTIYSLAAASSRSAEDSALVAGIAFVATIVVSYAVWRVFGRGSPAAEDDAGQP